MDKITSCCGVVCSACEYYPEDCIGCPDIKGKAFWLEYTGGEVCEIYDCCVNQKKLVHCGICAELPCRRFDADDPAKTPEQNAEDLKKQMIQLKSM